MAPEPKALATLNDVVAMQKKTYDKLDEILAAIKAQSTALPVPAPKRER